MLAVGVADAWYIGRLRPGPLAAVGFVFPVQITLTSLGIGTAAGRMPSSPRPWGPGDGGTRGAPGPTRCCSPPRSRRR